MVVAFNRTPDISSVFDFIVTTSERASFNPRTQKGGKVLVLQDLLLVGFRSAFIVDDSDEVINSIIDRQVQNKISGIHIKLRRKPPANNLFRPIGFLEDCVAHWPECAARCKQALRQ